MKSVRRVILHADDFGMNSAVNRGILTAFRDGLLTSTSLLANAPEAETAGRQWADLIADFRAKHLKSFALRKDLDDPAIDFDLGIHLNLSQGRPLTGNRYPPELLDENGNFPGIARVHGMRNLTAGRWQRVDTELRKQIEWMCDRGLKPTHLNGHQYVELVPAIAAMVPELLRRYAIPVVRVAFERGLSRTLLLRGDLKNFALGLVKRHYARQFRRRLRTINAVFPELFFGTCHAGRVDLRSLRSFLKVARRANTIEIGLHPGSVPDVCSAPKHDPWLDPLQDMRPDELQWLCNPSVQTMLREQGFSLGRLRQPE